MAVFQFSALGDGQSLVFNPNADVLNFDQTTVAAADLRVIPVGANLRVEVVGGPQAGKDVTLQNMSQLQLATTNVTFADGSKLLFGDNSTAQNDNLANSLTGTAGRDFLQGFGGADTMNGGAGSDTYIVGTGDVLSDGGGVDTVVTDVNWTLGAGFENVQMIGAGNISATGNNDANLAIGNAGNNYFNMRAGNDTIQAGAGNDWIDMSAFGTASYGDDVIEGGEGLDTLNFAISAGQQSGVVVDLTAGTFSGGGLGGAGSGTVTGVERVIGAAFNDFIKGGAASEDLRGEDGNDTLVGMGGSDGLFGGAGQDTFLFAAAPPSGHGIQDFFSGTDKLAFDNAVFTALGAAGNFVAGDSRFTAGAGFTSGRDADDRIIYNTSTGDLYYDADGNGAGAAQLVGFLSGHPALAATDIAVTGNNGAINGTGGDDSLVGTNGNDSIRGFDGEDTINGGRGNDTLTGGDGTQDTFPFTQDHFIFDQVPGAANADRITDFRFDVLHLDARVMPALGASGNFVSGDMRFHAAPGAVSGHDANDRVVYDTSTGNVYYDADGSGAGAAQLVVTLQQDAPLREVDIVVDNGTPGAVVQGTAGNDSLTGSVGNDSIDGLAGNDTIDTVDGDDTLLGGPGADSLTGGDGSDRLSGGDGNDTLNGGDFTQFGHSGIDTMDGGLGDDLYIIENPADVLSDSGGIDSIVASDMDFILGPGFENLELHNDVGEAPSTGIGNDLDNLMSITFAGGRLEGRGGNDTLLGSGRSDALDGGAGDDMLSGRGGFDNLTGGAGADSFILVARPDPSRFNEVEITDFASGVDRLRLDARAMPELGASGAFAAGDPRFFAAPGADAGHDADDRLVYDTASGKLYFDPDGSGAGAADVLATFQGAPALVATDITVDNGTGQTANGTAANDSLTGTEGNDSISGLAGSDTINALGGDDTLDGGAGIDALNGGLGNDTYIVTAGDALTDAGGFETVVSDVDWTLGGDFENLTMAGTGNIRVTGNSGDNLAIGNSGDNYFNLRAGNDTIQAGAGNDWIDMSAFGAQSYGFDRIEGGAGFDTVNFAISAGQQSGIFVDLTENSIHGGGVGGSGGAFVTSIERVVGAGFSDSIKGTAVAEALEGREGNDTLSGMGGNDTLSGGTGSDSFVFAAAPSSTNVDLVTDFVPGSDKAAFDNAVFTALGTDGNFVAGDARFAAGAGFTSGRDASDRIVYNTTTGQLFYDADGSGAEAAQLVATLQGAPAIAATDITVI